MCTYDTLLTPEVYITPPFAKDTFVLVSSPSKKREFIERFMLEDTQIVVLPNWIPEIIK